MKKYLPAIVILTIIGVVTLTGVFAYILFNKNLKKKPSSASTASQPTIPSVPVNTIPIIQRPYIVINPSASGREIIAVINRYGEAKKADLELEYQHGNQLEYIKRQVDFTHETPPIGKEFPLYTKSGGGKITYHENVSGGTLLIQYFNGHTIALKGEFSFQKMADREGFFSSRDAKFTFDLGKTALPAESVVIISQTFGLPGPVEGNILAGPYGVTGSQKPKGNQFALTMRLAEEVDNVQLLAWGDNQWDKITPQVTGKQLMATIDSLTTFVAVKPN